jgi:FixJ family two-component response regulator
MTAPKAVVLLVDDELSIRTTLSCLLEACGYEVIAFASAEEFLLWRDRPAAGCLLLDLNLPGVNGLKLQDQLLAEGRNLPIVFITGAGDIPDAVQAMKSGAVDFLAKPLREEALLRAVSLAVEKGRHARTREEELAGLRKRLATLTSRQTEVLHLVLIGMLNKQVAAELGIAEKTVKFHRAQVMKKLRVNSVAELVRLSERAGFFTPASPSRTQ